MSVYLVEGVEAKIGGSKLHQALSREHADGVAVLGSKRLRDRMCSPLIWSKSQLSLIHVKLFCGMFRYMVQEVTHQQPQIEDLLQ